VAWNSIGLNR